MLKIYTDENVESAIAKGLRRRNIDAMSANEMNNLGLKDEQQLEYAVSIRASFFTYDNDFFKIAKDWSDSGKNHFGIFYVHPLSSTIGECIRKLKEYSELFEPEDVMNQIIFL
ncbi:DUF5615 family PIN-like protein [candidate division KSB1 bacterium]|nr:DUF5615 family PIN-like protein [candidate division KSB1 bacterium]